MGLEENLMSTLVGFVEFYWQHAMARNHFSVNEGHYDDLDKQPLKLSFQITPTLINQIDIQNPDHDHVVLFLFCYSSCKIVKKIISFTQPFNQMGLAVFFIKI